MERFYLEEPSLNRKEEAIEYINGVGGLKRYSSSNLMNTRI